MWISLLGTHPNLGETHLYKEFELALEKTVELLLEHSLCESTTKDGKTEKEEWEREHPKVERLVPNVPVDRTVEAE